MRTEEIPATDKNLGSTNAWIRETMRDGSYEYETLFVDWETNEFEWRAYFSAIGFLHETWNLNFFGMERCELVDNYDHADMIAWVFKFPADRNPVEVFEELVNEMRERQAPIK